jgi:hypothetical protein
MTLIINVDQRLKIDEEIFLTLVGALNTQIISSERFIVKNSDEIPIIGQEYALTYIFNLDGDVPDFFEQQDLRLVLTINNFSFEKETRRNNYLLNNDSGDYIYDLVTYIKVETGTYYVYDATSKTYKKDNEKGTFVKGADGKYYRVQNFYMRYPHNEEYIKSEISMNIQLSEVKTGKIITNRNTTIKSEEQLSKYAYDNISKKVVKISYPSNKIISKISSSANSSFSYLADLLMKLYPIQGRVIGNIKDRVYINVGKNEGVKNGLVFKIEEGKNFAYIEITEVDEFAAEAVITKMNYDMNFKMNQIANEYFGFYKPLPFNLGVSLGNEFLLNAGFRSTDIYSKTKSYFGFSLKIMEDLDLSNFEISLLDEFKLRSLDTAFSVYSNKIMNILIRSGTNFEDIYLGGQINLLNNFALYTDYFIIDQKIKIGTLIKIFE